MNIKTGTIRVYSKGGVTHYATCEMKVGDMATLKLDTGESYNFNLESLNVIVDGCESDALVVDLRDRSWLEEL